MRNNKNIVDLSNNDKPLLTLVNDLLIIYKKRVNTYTDYFHGAWVDQGQFSQN